MNAWMGTLCPGLCVAVPHHQLCAAPSAGERVDSCEGQSSSCSCPFPKLDCHALLDFLFSIFFSTRSKAIIRTFFFFLGKVIRVLFYTVLKKYNFLLFELKVTTQHSKPTLSSTYSRLWHEQTASLQGSELDAPAEALLPPNRRQHAR